ncbi:MAG: hypothetical protein E7534_06055 [Ruminococcaceae bacterium]|nr:hypothetical protein [Oscillospiraceae bacterium]MBQ2781200.1 hypothetical protein [Clostridia bacterium]
MQKIQEGKYEVFTTREDAIEKFMQLEGVCREEISGENQIAFYCYESGNVYITDPPARSADNTNSTNLYGKVITQDGKTYVTYYTGFRKSNQVFKIISLIFMILLAIGAIVLSVIQKNITVSVVALALCLIVVVNNLRDSAREGQNSPRDSEILVKELERRVEAVNKWDK